MPEERTETSSPADFILEVGTEELPPGDLRAALAQLEAQVPAFYWPNCGWRTRMSEVMGTPRRLVVQVQDLAARQADLEEEVKGPACGSSV